MLRQSVRLLLLTEVYLLVFTEIVTRVCSVVNLTENFSRYSLQVSRRLERKRDTAPDNQQRLAVGGRLEEAVLCGVRQMAIGPRTGVCLRGQLQPKQQPHRRHCGRRRAGPVV